VLKLCDAGGTIKMIAEVKINLCNSVEVLTNSFGTVISGRQV
ncbi:hypothetical protein, partial [Escherichia coli]